MNLILLADAINPPLAGIGHYALQLTYSLRQHPDIEDLRFFAGDGKVLACYGLNRHH